MYSSHSIVRVTCLRLSSRDASQPNRARHDADGLAWCRPQQTALPPCDPANYWPSANQIRRRLPRLGDKWHLDEVLLKIAGVKHWLWRAVDQAGVVLDVLVQRRRDKQAAKRLIRKLLKKHMRPPRVIITDKLASHTGKREVSPH
jgi:hypothetical protein